MPCFQLVQHYIDSLPDNLFFVLHTYGSHFNYFERYPREFAHFTPDEATEVEVKNRQQLINAYDNSIRYTDYFSAPSDPDSGFDESYDSTLL